jgi:hypothetical protein
MCTSVLERVDVFPSPETITYVTISGVGQNAETRCVLAKKRKRATRPQTPVERHQ